MEELKRACCNCDNKICKEVDGFIYYQCAIYGHNIEHNSLVNHLCRHWKYRIWNI